MRSAAIQNLARLSIDGRQDPGTYEYPVNTEDQQECQSDEDQGGHVGEPLG